MSKKTNRRLSLHRETLRQLDAQDLSRVAGAYVPKRTYTCPTYTCANTNGCGSADSRDCCGDM